MVSKRKQQTLPEWGDFIGIPVCAILKDGSYYIGQVEGIRNGELILTGFRGQGKVPMTPSGPDQAQISGFLGSMFGGGAGGFPFFGGGGAGGGLGGGLGAGAGAGQGGGQGFFGKIWPGLRIGLGMLQMVMPLVGRFMF